MSHAFRGRGVAGVEQWGLLTWLWKGASAGAGSCCPRAWRGLHPERVLSELVPFECQVSRVRTCLGGKRGGLRMSTSHWGLP